MGLVEGGAYLSAEAQELVTAVMDLWTISGEPAEHPWEVATQKLFTCYLRSMGQLTLEQQRGVFELYMDLSKARDLILANDDHVSHHALDLTLQFFTMAWRTLHVLVSSYDTVRTSVFEPVPSRPGATSHPEPSPVPEEDPRDQETDLEDGSDETPRSLSPNADSEFLDAEAGDDKAWKAGFPFKERLGNIVHDATCLVAEVTTVNWFRGQLELVVERAMADVNRLESQSPDLMREVYASLEPLYTKESCTGVRRVFRGSALTPEQRKSLDTRQIKQIILHQALSILEMKEVLKLVRAFMHSGLALVQRPVQVIASQVIGTMLSINLNRDFEGVADRLITPIKECYYVNEQLKAMRVPPAADKWRRRAIESFGSRLHRALRYEDQDVLKHEERFYLASCLMKICTTALPKLMSSESTVSTRLHMLKTILSKSEGALMKLVLVLFDIREPSPTLMIQEKIDQIFSSDFINQRIAEALLVQKSTTWSGPFQCEDEVASLQRHIAIAPTEAIRAEERYKLTRVLLVEMCDQACGGANAMATRKMLAICLTVHDLLQHPLFLKHVLFTVLDELVHVVVRASSESNVTSALSRSVTGKTEPVCMLDCVTEQTTHNLMAFLVQVLADSSIDSENDTWTQTLVGGAAWAAKYVAPVGFIKDLLEDPIRNLLASALTFDTQAMVVQTLERVHDFILDPSEAGLGMKVLKALFKITAAIPQQTAALGEANKEAEPQ
eukprot:TRINITY_DN6320_c0_g1_i1.p1 TRINITY_DN6320_c0_g1~~TRINITY_DN6320_c0_g1_i1.p1  ORF type:complete len:727 (+),score=193.37 TRINITY_DN6320_c0_g1_i1:906-3086(+)